MHLIFSMRTLEIALKFWTWLIGKGNNGIKEAGKDENEKQLPKTKKLDKRTIV